ncbi:unnamed protein product [Moneuplotes crassus]|uniref:Uncharacterized protein n=1 Tax=Euplotes crassus TaxID=5936 RepID=A0AAD1XC78_EUPCR|nr:unnamed protein product [Moneuplotes crassus]
MDYNDTPFTNKNIRRAQNSFWGSNRFNGYRHCTPIIGNRRRKSSKSANPGNKNTLQGYLQNYQGGIINQNYARSSRLRLVDAKKKKMLGKENSNETGKNLEKHSIMDLIKRSLMKNKSTRTARESPSDEKRSILAQARIRPDFVSVRNHRTAIISKRNQREYGNHSYISEERKQSKIIQKAKPVEKRPQTSIRSKQRDLKNDIPKNLNRNASTLTYKNKSNQSESSHHKRSISLHNSQRFYGAKRGVFYKNSHNGVVIEDNKSKLFIRPTSSLNRSCVNLQNEKQENTTIKNQNDEQKYHKPLQNQSSELQVNFKFLWKLPDSYFSSNLHVGKKTSKHRIIKKSNNIIKGLSKPGISVPKVSYKSKMECKVDGVGLNLNSSLYG